MFRKLLLIPILAATLVACGGGNKGAGDVAATESAGVVGAAECPTSNTKAFAKTRFVADAGIAFGAFHRWIYKPYKAGSFQTEASGRTKALVKAGVAGAFAVYRLNAARKMVDASPLLCKTLKAPLAALSASLGALAGRLKSGNFHPSEIDSVNGQVEGARQEAGRTGTPITDKDVPIPGI
jgi:hypothetical protein